MADKYVATTGVEPWATNSLVLPSSLEEARVNAVAGDTVHIKAGTYVLAASFSPVNAGTRNAPIVWTGYNAAPGDSDAPVATFDINGLALTVIECLQAHHRFEFITVTGNSGVGGAVFGCDISGIANTLYRCRATGVNKGIKLAGQGSHIAACESDNWTSGAGLILAADNTSAFGCFIHDGGGWGIGLSSDSSGGFYSCISARNATHGFAAGQDGDGFARYVVNCLAYNNGEYGVSINGSSTGQPFQIQNSLLINNGLYGIGGANVATGTPNVSLYGCGFFGNISGEVDPSVYVFEPGGRLSLSADPFVDAANNDFRVRSQAGVSQVGWPANFLVNGSLSPWQNYADLGAVQKREWSRV